MSLDALSWSEVGEISYRIEYKFVAYDDIMENHNPPIQRDDEDEDDFSEREAEWEQNFRRNHVLLPEPGEFKTVDERRKNVELGEDGNKISFDLRRSFERQGFQVIVKLANIHLTPEKPE